MKNQQQTGFLMPFGFVINLIIVLFVVSTSMAIHLPWFFLSKKNSLDLVSKINNEIAINMSFYIDNIFTGNSKDLNSINHLISKGVIDIENEKEIRWFFLSVLFTNPEVSWISYGFPNGSFVGAQRISKHEIKFHDRKYDPTTKISNNTIYHYKIKNDNYKYIKTTTSTSSYNAIKRSWYKTAIKNDGISWTNVYVFSTSKKPGINVAMKNISSNSKKLQGVVSIAIELGKLSHHVAKIKVGKTGNIFIMDRKKQLIASKDFNKIMKDKHIKGTKRKLIKITDVKDNTAMRIVSALIEKEDIDIYSINGVKEYIYFDEVLNNTRVILSKVPNIDLMIAIVVPEIDFLVEIERNTRMLFLLILFLVVLSIFIATILIKFIISKPISDLIDSTNHIKSFDLDKVTYTKSNVQEIKKLSDAMDMMKRSLTSFKKYIPLNIVKELVNSTIEAKIGGKEKVVTIFFSDIENFTNISEQLGIKLFPHLEEYFSEMSNEIQKTNGTIDKYIGDAIMAFWNAPSINPKHPIDACMSALNCQNQLKKLRLKWKQHGKPLLYTRIGINTGVAMVGNIGSDYKMDYTVLGDSVNLASRLEAINKVYKTDIVISENTYELVKDTFATRKIDAVAVKGKKQGVAIYELLATKEDNINFDWVKKYEEALELMYSEKLKEALDTFKTVSSIKGTKDFASDVMIDRCKSFIENGNFTKTFTMTTK